jgi:hypothetical protein
VFEWRLYADPPPNAGADAADLATVFDADPVSDRASNRQSDRLAVPSPYHGAFPRTVTGSNSAAIAAAVFPPITGAISRM